MLVTSTTLIKVLDTFKILKKMNFNKLMYQLLIIRFTSKHYANKTKRVFT